ncbi:MAG: hypothetical protein ACRC9O_03750 [Plesiomonas sp.]|uniref:hypothetical protein n=1 Tax=Plesiomonas sp. TaxID=2486279 RepID=UPI003F3AC1C3
MTFTTPEPNPFDELNTVNIEVRNNNRYHNEGSAKATVDIQQYQKICDALQLKTQLKIPQTGHVLTKSGGLDLYKKLKQGHFKMGIHYVNSMPILNHSARKRASLCPLIKC